MYMSICAPRYPWKSNEIEEPKGKRIRTFRRALIIQLEIESGFS